MVALRSRRLETILGASLDELQYHHLEALVTNHIHEEFDLDFPDASEHGRGALDAMFALADVRPMCAEKRS